MRLLHDRTLGLRLVDVIERPPHLDRGAAGQWGDVDAEMVRLFEKVLRLGLRISEPGAHSRLTDLRDSPSLPP